MKERLNAVNANLTSAIAAMHDLHTELVNTANAQKKNLLEILAAMRLTRDTMTSLGNMCAQAGASLFDINDFCVDMSDKITATLDGFSTIPSGIYETFVGFCEDCGKEIHTTDLFEKTEDGTLLCSDCVYTPDYIIN